MARKSGDSLESVVESVIVVVRARHHLGRDSQIGELADVLRDKSGWKFELALVEAEARVDVPDMAVPFDLKEIWGYHNEVNKLLDAGFKEAAVLTAWAAAEAAVRLLLELDGDLIDEEGVSPERIPMPRLLSSAVYYGVISREDYSRLTRVKRQRDAYAHGFVLPDVDAGQIAREILSTTIEILEQGQNSDSD